MIVKVEGRDADFSFLKSTALEIKPIAKITLLYPGKTTTKKRLEDEFEEYSKPTRFKKSRQFDVGM